MQLGNYDLMMLRETNIWDEAYCRNRLLYAVVRSQEVGTAAGVSEVGVGMVIRERPDG